MVEFCMVLCGFTFNGENMNSARFSTFDLPRDVPNVCGVCLSNTPIFRFEFLDDCKNMLAEYMKGFCCAPCAIKLLEVLEHVESQEWAHQQAALEDEGTDTTEFQKRRLAAFGVQ
jgi:hypothetical protein